MVVALDVYSMEDSRAPFVVDIELVDGVGKTFNKVGDNETVVNAVAVGCYHVGELEVVVDEEDGVLYRVGALEESAARTVVVRAGNQTDGVVTRDVLTVGDRPLPRRIVVRQGVEGVGHVLVVLNLPEVVVSSVVGSSIVD